jgi:excisionase family DNA binding protein
MGKRIEAVMEDTRVRVIEYPRVTPPGMDGTVPEKLRKMRGGISAKQLAPILGVSQATIYKMAERQGLPSYRVGGRLLFDPAAIAKWLEG